MMGFGILLILRMKNLHFDVAQHTFKGKLARKPTNLQFVGSSQSYLELK